MKKKSIGFIIGLMGFALLGVMAMQLYFLRQSYQMQSDLFDRSVNDALNNVVTKLAKEDAINFLNAKAQVYNKNMEQRRKEALESANENHIILPKKRHLTARESKLRFF